MNTPKFIRLLVLLNGAVPLLVLAWDAYFGQLGANSVNYALHVTGILSLVFLVLSLLITPLRWISGWGGWIACRRALGLYGFFYAIVHLGIYVALDREFNLSSTAYELWTRRFLQVGTAALILMIPLAATSTNAMIQKLGPKRWKRLHRLAYVATILGVVHYYMLVKSDVRQPIAFGVIVFVLLAIRFVKYYLEQKGKVTPHSQKNRGQVKANGNGSRSAKFWKGELKIAALVQETPDVKTFRLVHPSGGELPFEYQPGQYMNLHLTVDGVRVNRSYTIASSPTWRGYCELSIKREPNGTASRYLHDRLKVGDAISVSAPAGKFVFTGGGQSGVVLIAGGVGITPVMSILRYLTDRTWERDIYFVIVAKTQSDIIFRKELEELVSRKSNLHLCVTLTRPNPNEPWDGKCGRLNGELIRSVVPNLHECPVYLCGPNEMMDCTRQLLLDEGVPEEFIHTEAFVSPKANLLNDVELRDKSIRGDNSAESGDARSIEVLSTIQTEDAKYSVVFERSRIAEEIESSSTVLEAAEVCSVDLPFECRSGVCGQCKTRLLKGTVRMDNQDALSQAERRAGWILACQSHPQSNIVVEA